MTHGLGLAVVSYHSAADLEGFVESFRSSVGDTSDLDVSLQVHLVEATPEERVHAEQLQRGVDFELVCHSDNVGYARACNDAACRFGPAVNTYAFFNADTRLRPGSLEKCIETLWSDVSYGILGPRQVDDEGRITHAGIEGCLERPMHRGWHELAGLKFKDLLDDCVTVSGSAYFVKRSCWEQLRDCPSYRAADPTSTGAFLVTPHFYEESFCSYHAHSHGWKVVYEGRDPATIVHRWHKASPVNGWASQQFPISRQIFRTACEAHDPPILHD